ncbi:ROK family transcriptional regulator [Arthrobacter flavus]
MREMNSWAILARLKSAPSMSVSALSAATGLSRQAVGRSLEGLASAGLVQFLQPDRTAARSGRPAQLVRFRAEAGKVLGVCLGPKEIRVAVADLLGNVVSSEVTQLPANAPAQEAVASLLAAIETVLLAAGSEQQDLWWATVGTPGIVDPETGFIKLIPSMTGLAGNLLARSLRDALTCPVYLDNDIKLAAQGAHRQDAQDVSPSLVFISWGERVGAGILLNGELYRGSSNDAGDIGFLDLVVDTRQAMTATAQTERAGLGRFEAWVGTAELLHLARISANEHFDSKLLTHLKTVDDYAAFDAFVAAVRADKPAALAALNEVCRRFALGILAVRAILDPDLIVLGGWMAKCGERLIDTLLVNLSNQQLGAPRIELSELDDDAVVQGAIAHALSELNRAKFHRPGAGRTPV